MLDEEYFSSFLDKESTFIFPEGTFLGKEGFKEWYKSIKQTIKPNNSHIVTIESIVKETENYLVNLFVHFKAETYSNSIIDVKVKESWKVAVTMNGQIKIRRYNVVQDS